MSETEIRHRRVHGPRGCDRDRTIGNVGFEGRRRLGDGDNHRGVGPKIVDGGNQLACHRGGNRFHARFTTQEEAPSRPLDNEIEPRLLPVTPGDGSPVKPIEIEAK